MIAARIAARPPTQARRSVVVTAFLLCATAIHAQTPPQLPAGRAGDAVREYIAVIGGGDSLKIHAWLKRYDPDGDLNMRAGKQMAVARRTGGFTVERIIRGTAEAVEAVLREKKTQQQVRIVLVMGSDGVAEGFGIEPFTGSPPAGNPAPPNSSAATATATSRPKDQAELVLRLGRFLDSLSAADRFAGVVSLSRNGSAVLEKAYGFADREKRIPNSIETAFNLGSINKIFTATAVRQLAADGRLHLDSSLARAWPSYPNAEIARRVTVRQLLDHTSGIAADIFDVPGATSPATIRHNNDFLRAVTGAPLKFEPGSREQYSNAGYVVLGGLIAAVSGEDYYAYVERHIFAPAAMTRTAHYRNDSLPARTAVGYTRGGDEAPSNAPLRTNSKLLPGRGSAAGGGYSTIGDLKRFLAALRSRSIPGGPPPGVGVAGGADGMNAVLDGDLPGGYDLIVLANMDPPSAERVARQVHAWLGEQ